MANLGADQSVSGQLLWCAGTSAQADLTQPALLTLLNGHFIITFIIKERACLAAAPKTRRALAVNDPEWREATGGGEGGITAAISDGGSSSRPCSFDGSAWTVTPPQESEALLPAEPPPASSSTTAEADPAPVSNGDTSLSSLSSSCDGDDAASSQSLDAAVLALPPACWERLVDVVSPPPATTEGAVAHTSLSMICPDSGAIAFVAALSARPCTLDSQPLLVRQPETPRRRVRAPRTRARLVSPSSRSRSSSASLKEPLEGDPRPAYCCHAV